MAQFFKLSKRIVLVLGTQSISPVGEDMTVGMVISHLCGLVIPILKRDEPSERIVFVTHAQVIRQCQLGTETTCIIGVVDGVLRGAVAIGIKGYRCQPVQRIIAEAGFTAQM